MISRQKFIGWTIIIMSVGYIAYFLRVRALGSGPVLERKEWVYFILSFGGIMLGTINVRMAAARERRQRGEP